MVCIVLSDVAEEVRVRCPDFGGDTVNFGDFVLRPKLAATAGDTLSSSGPGYENCKEDDDGAPCCHTGDAKSSQLKYDACSASADSTGGVSGPAEDREEVEQCPKEENEKSLPARFLPNEDDFRIKTASGVLAPVDREDADQLNEASLVLEEEEDICEEQSEDLRVEMISGDVGGDVKSLMVGEGSRTGERCVDCVSLSGAGMFCRSFTGTGGGDDFFVGDKGVITARGVAKEGGKGKESTSECVWCCLSLKC